MRLNADFSERVVLRPEDRDWVASPMAGVDRQMLDRIGEEVGERQITTEEKNLQVSAGADVVRRRPSPR